MRSKMFSKKLFSTSQLENNMVFQKISIVHVWNISEIFKNVKAYIYYINTVYVGVKYEN